MAGGVLALAGAIWCLRGVGVIGAGFVSGHAVWAVVDAVLVVGGALLVALDRSPRDG